MEIKSDEQPTAYPRSHPTSRRYLFGSGGSSRILLLYALVEKPRTVNELTNDVKISQSATSRHLKVLRERGLVSANRMGQSIEYSLTDPRIIEALDLLRAVLRDGISRRANLMTKLNDRIDHEKYVPSG